MKTLYVIQPWANALVDGAKTFEVRSWTTPHRGLLLICARASPENVLWRNEVNKVNRVLYAGCVIGIVDLLDCRGLGHI